MDTFDLHRMAEQAARSRPEDLLDRAIIGVLRHAQEGDLPLFAWTLGLTQTAYRQMLAQRFPELRALTPIPEAQYLALLQAVPADFYPLRNMLMMHRSATADKQQADWLARALAIACQGGRHLWQDLGLQGRDEVSRLLQDYFAPLAERNIHHLKWKKWIYQELGQHLGQKNLQAPQCRRCPDYSICFPQ